MRPSGFPISEAKAKDREKGEKTGETSGDQVYQLGKSRGPNSRGSQDGFSLSHKTVVASVYSSIM